MKLLFRQVLFVLLFTFRPQNGSAGPRVIYKIKSLECSTNKDFVVNVSCSVAAVSWLKSYINIDVDLVKILNNTSVRVSFYKKDNTNQYKPFLFAFNFNMCNNDQKYLLIPYSSLVVDHMRKYTNLNHSCPYMGHMFARNLQLEDDIVPDVPVSVYRLSFKFFENSIQIAHIQFAVEALERRKLKIIG